MKKIIYLVISIFILVLTLTACTAQKAGSGAAAQDASKLTLDEVKKKYTDSKILDIQNIGDDFVLVESQKDTFANRFDLYNLQTGSMDNLKDMKKVITKDNQYISSYEIIHKDNKIYLAINVRDSAKMYTIKIRRLDMPEEFPYFEVEFKGDEVNND